jgi:hypothetical protein
MLALAVAAGYLVVSEPVAAQESVPSPSRAPAAAPLPGTSPATRAARPGGGGTAGTPGRKSVRAKAFRGYRYLLMQPDGVTPIRWNPCRPLHYRISLGGLVPASEVARVRAAFGAAGAALGGVQFSYDGPTTVVPDTVDDAGRAGADIVFAFSLPGSGPARSALLTGWEAGRGGFAATGAAGAQGRDAQHPTHGSIVIDAAKWKIMTRHDRTVLYLHEIGHVAGLDHPADGHQIMTSGAYDLPARYQTGDLAGLATLGRQAGCTA